MSVLSAFLHPAAREETAEVIVSKRFLDEEGKPVPFKVRSLTQEENDGFLQRATRWKTDSTGQSRETVDQVDYTRRLVAAATVEPDFSSRELCEAYGVMDPLLVAGKMLRPGEYQRLTDKILELSGFAEDETAEDAAKN